MDHLIFIFLALVFLILNAVYNGAETGLVALDVDYLRSRASKTAKGSKEKRLLALARHPEHYLAVTLIAINSSFVVGTSLFTTVVEDLLPDFIGILTVSLSVVMFVFCQFIPKMAFNHRPLNACLKSLTLLKIADFLFKIPVKVVTKVTRFVLRIFGITNDDNLLSRDELLILLSHGVNSGTIHKESNKMAAGIIGLRETSAREVMIPRMQVLAFDVKSPVEEIKKQMLASGYSRVPIYEGEIDQVVGMLYFKDLFLKDENSITVRDMISEPMFVPESKSAFELFREMRLKSAQIAIVVDEFASMSGIVAFEDLIEEVVGEIHDEFDKPKNELKFNDDGSVTFAGDLNIYDLNERAGFSFCPVDHVTTMNGLVLSVLGRIPGKGESFMIDGVRFKIIASDQRKVEWLKIIS